MVRDSVLTLLVTVQNNLHKYKNSYDSPLYSKYVEYLSNTINYFESIINEIKDQKDKNRIINILKDAKEKIGTNIKLPKLVTLSKEILTIIIKVANGTIIRESADQQISHKIITYERAQSLFPRRDLLLCIEFLLNEINEVPTLKSEEYNEHINVAADVLKKLKKEVNQDKNAMIDVNLLFATYKQDYKKEYNANQIVLIDGIFNGILDFLNINADPNELNEKISNINLMLEMYHKKGYVPSINILSSYKEESEPEIEEGDDESEPETEEKPKTNYLTILYWILVAIVVIVGILFILGLIFGFIYAIRAEGFNTKWSTKRVIGRTFLGFAFVAMYWNKYGIW